MRKYFAMLTIAAFLCATGCASRYGEQRTQVNYYPRCYQPIADLRARENTVSKSTAGGALLGAFTGAMIGLLASGGKWQGAVVGGATGGVAGTMAGNMYGRKQQERDDNIRLASYLQDIDGDISNMDISTAAARTSLQCYDQQFQVLLGEMKARQITREAAAQRFAEISTGREEAIAILGDTVQYGQNLSQQYEQALATEEQQVSAPARVAANERAYRQNRQTIQAAKGKTRTLHQKVAAASQEHQQALADTSRQTREINNVYAELQDIRS